jgi:leucyl aminopeptidase
MPPRFAPPDPAAIPLDVIDRDGFDPWLAGQAEITAGWVAANGFAGVAGQALLIPGADGRPAQALAGYGSAGDRARKRFVLAEAAAKLPAGTYDIRSDLGGQALETECFGWLMTTRRFDRYKAQTAPAARLLAPVGIDAARVEAMVAAETLIRDLVDTPAADMGPADLDAAARTLAAEFGATVETTEGEALLAQNLPMIHAVGRASTRAPRLIDLRWGNAGPCLTLVGKGVCFDTGGLDLKPAAGMALMKKDMGGAAHVLGLARMIMAQGLALRLRVLIPAVENAVAGNAFRPGDILTARNGLTVEVNNTDAEGRLVLADALALAAEETPDLVISMATLTGAARVAVGPDIAPFYTDDDAAAQALADAALRVADPVWRMPFHAPYEAMIEPDNADLDNAPSGGFAGSITAALFLRRFAGNTRYMHFDIYAWQPAAAPARPKGGVGQAVRALFATLPDLVGR